MMLFGFWDSLFLWLQKQILTIVLEKRLGSLDCEWVFQASDNKSAAKTWSFTSKFNSIRYLCKIPKELNPLCLRHSFATHMLQHNHWCIYDVKCLLGHSSLVSTEIYVMMAKVFNNDNTKSPSEVCQELTWCFSCDGYK